MWAFEVESFSYKSEEQLYESVVLERKRKKQSPEINGHLLAEDQWCCHQTKYEVTCGNNSSCQQVCYN